MSPKSDKIFSHLPLVGICPSMQIISVLFARPCKLCLYPDTMEVNRISFCHVQSSEKWHLKTSAVTCLPRNSVPVPLDLSQTFLWTLHTKYSLPKQMVTLNWELLQSTKTRKETIRYPESDKLKDKNKDHLEHWQQEVSEQRRVKGK